MDTDPNKVVKEDVTDPQPSEGQVNNQPGTEGSPAPEGNPAPAGSQTDPALLLESLKDERTKRKVLEDKIDLLEEKLNNNLPGLSADDIESDEGKVLQGEISSLKKELSGLKEDKQLDKISTDFPAIKENLEDFNTFRASYPGVALESVAKLFLSEKGLMESKKRPGLEEPTGGDMEPISSGMTSDEVRHLRETNPRKYKEMLDKDQIKIVDKKNSRR